MLHNCFAQQCAAIYNQDNYRTRKRGYPRIQWCHAKYAKLFLQLWHHPEDSPFSTNPMPQNLTLDLKNKKVVFLGHITYMARNENVENQPFSGRFGPVISVHTVNIHVLVNLKTSVSLAHLSRRLTR